MKIILSVLFLSLLHQNFAVAGVCENKAENAIRQNSFFADRYVGEQIYVYECNQASNAGLVICQAVAYKGSGEASDDWKVVMNKTCSKVLRIDLTAEE